MYSIQALIYLPFRVDSYSTRWSQSQFYDFYFGSDDEDDQDADDYEERSSSIQAVEIKHDEEDDLDDELCSDKTQSHLSHGEI